MVDPPASTPTDGQRRRSIDPVAASSTPKDNAETGDSDKLLGNSGSGRSSDDQENTPKDQETAASWEPPADLSALKLSRTSIRERTASMPSMPKRIASRSSSTGSTASTPLMSESNNNAFSPTVLPPATPEQASNKSKATPQSSTSAKTTSISRKAQRYSSLKKRKGPNTLLNRLFCNTPMGNSSLLADDDEDDVAAENSTVDQQSSNVSAEFIGGSSEENHSPNTHENRSQKIVPADHTKAVDESPCTNVTKTFLKQTKENLTLHDEDKVRHSIQTSIQDALLDACAAPKAPSPPQVQIDSSKDGNDDSTVGSLGKMKLVGDAAVGSSQNGSAKKVRSKKSAIIKAPDTKISVFHDDEIAETVSSPLPEVAKPDVVRVSKSADEVAKTPLTVRRGSKQGGKAMKTPGGLVIPSPFTFSGTVFPSTLENCYTNKSYSVQKSPPRAKTPPKKTPQIEEEKKSETTAEASSIPSSVIVDNDKPLLSLSASSNSDKMQDDRVKEQRDESPPPMARITSSLEDLSTVPEVSSSKETATVTDGKSKDVVDDDDDAFLPNDIVATESSKKPSTSDTRRFKEALEHAKKDWEKDFGEKLRAELQREHEMKLKESVSSSSDQSTLPDTIQELKDKYERKINEHKDKAKMKELLAQRRQEEIELLEAQLQGIAQTRNDEKEMRAQLDRVKQEREIEVRRLKAEVNAMEMKLQEATVKTSSKTPPTELSPEKSRLKKELDEVKKKLADANSKSPTKPQHGELQRVKRELADMKSKLEAKEKESRLKSPVKANQELQRTKKELASVKAQLASKENELASKMTEDCHEAQEVVLSSSSASAAELERVKQELADVKKELSGRAKAPRELEAELQQVKDELSTVKESLAAREKELNDIDTAKKQHSTNRGGSPARTIPRLTPGSPPLRSGGRGKRQSSSASNESQPQNVEAAELLKRERDRLLEQIERLDKQAAETSKEHERALNELQKASEQEVMRVKQDLESRLDYQREKERELKESFSEASAREKDELLQQIERLREENDRTGSLREVQNKEDLLQRILAQEKREKDLVESHERAMQELRTEGELEAQKLRLEMDKQQEARAARELELETAISETCSLEKKELLQKVETLQNQLESERNGAVLERLKLSNVEKDAAESERMHQETMEALQKKNVEIERLQTEIDKRTALEETMQIMENEKKQQKEELAMLRKKVEQDVAQHSKNIEELRKKHAEDILALKEQHNESIREVEQKNQNCVQEEKRKYDAKIAELLTKHSENEAQLKSQVHDTEVKYKALLCESNEQFESFKKKSDETIEVLRKDLQTKEKNAEGDLLQLLEENEKLKASLQANEIELRESKEAHDRQFEEILSQLDLVEADYQGKLSEKEAIVSALGAQLAEAQKKMNDAQQKLAEDADLVKQEQEKCLGLEEQLESLKKEVQTLKDDRKKFAKDAAVAQEKACEEAREEMIEKAEIQFQQANEHYIKLRKQYDSSQERVKKLESELKSLKGKLTKVSKEKESCEIDLKAEVAQLNATNAKIEADAAQKAKEYRKEMERLLAAAKDFEQKAEAEVKTSRNIQTTLATVVAEKEKLQKEYEEMKSVSEELMAIVEGQGHHEC